MKPTGSRLQPNRKSLAIGAASALALAASLFSFSSPAEATCDTEHSGCKDEYGCVACIPYGRATVDGNTPVVMKAVTDGKGKVTQYILRLASLKNVTVEPIEIGSSATTIVARVICTNGGKRYAVEATEVNKVYKTPDCPPNYYASAGEAWVNFPDYACPYEQACDVP